MDPTRHAELTLNELRCHPSRLAVAVAHLRAGVSRAPGSIALRFDLRGQLDRLTIPPFRTPERADRLWRRTCFEAFLHRLDEPGYLELNVSPSGQWAAYRFDGYRRGMRDLELGQSPVVTVRRAGDRLELDLLLSSIQFPGSSSNPIRTALCAVIEDVHGALSFWALAHPTDRPDFHHPDGAVLELGEPKPPR